MDRTYTAFREYVEDIESEDDGFSLLRALMWRFGWAGTVFCRGDVESRWQEMTDTDVSMPDHIWEKVQSDYAWRHMDEMLSEAGNDTIGLIVEDIV
jgi:hypothetical protein